MCSAILIETKDFDIEGKQCNQSSEEPKEKLEIGQLLWVGLPEAIEHAKYQNDGD